LKHPESTSIRAERSDGFPALDHLSPGELEHLAARIHGVQRERWDNHVPPPSFLSWPMRALLSLIVLVVFFACTRQGSPYRFDVDDIMNLHQGYAAPAKVLLRALVFPFTTFNRPVGGLYYRICFDLFGWNPPAFRSVTVTFMMANLALLYLLARRLTGSVEMGAIAALLFSFHGRLGGIYSSNGTVYDVLCASFTLLTLWYYIRTRQESKPWTVPRICILLLFYIAALNAKEMAVIVPLLLLLFEWICCEPRDLRRKAWLPVALMVLTAAAIWGKMQPGGPFYGNLYSSEYTLRRFFQNARSLQSEFFYLPARTLSPRQVIGLWVALVVIPVWVKPRMRKPLWFSAAFALLGPLPAIFVPYRGFYVMYLPMAGWAIYCSTLFVMARNWMAREVRRRRPMGPGGWAVARLSLAAAVALLVANGTRDSDFRMPRTDPMLAIIENTRADFLRLNEPLPEHSRSLLLHSRFPADSWEPLMIARLLYRDPVLWLDRPTLLSAPVNDAAIAGYDRVFDFDGERMFIVARRVAGTSQGRLVELPH
jgi:hypothetical protein